MKYYEFKFLTTPASEDIHDVLAAVLAEIGFDSFVPADDGSGALLAYIKVAEYDKDNLEACISAFPLENVSIQFSFQEAEDKDWNEEWEKNYFKPLVVDGRCVVSSTFHKDVPTAEYAITIDPRMSFGTGHHATTSQMISEILDCDMQGKNVLDMGCGTSILAILACMRGAKQCTAIDNDEWCVTNSLENIELNHIDNINVMLGDASTLADKGPFDVIIANINRNILLADMRYYAERMTPGATLFMSGFYVEDIPIIREEAERLGLTFDHARDLNRWAAVKFTL